MPNYLGGGQSFVQAGNNNGGGFSRLAMFGVGAFQMKMGHMMRRDLISAQGEEQRKTISHKTDEGFRESIGQGYIHRQNATTDYDTIFDKDQDGNYKRPEMAAHFGMGGLERNKYGIQAGPVAGIKIEELRAEGRDTALKTEEAKTKNTPPPGEKKTKKPKMGEEGFMGYTPRKTGTGGYDEALKEGKIDQETYDSYLEDSKKPGKDYMPKQASTAVDTLVKERQAAENNNNTTPPPGGDNVSRTDNLNTGTGEGK